MGFSGDDPVWNFGWIKNEEETKKFLSTLPHPTFDEAAPHLKGYGEGKDVFLWEVEPKVLGSYSKSWDQGSLGSCVAKGSGRAAQILLMLQIVAGNGEWRGEVAREPIYGGSRVNVGGQRGSYSDGSTGSWAAKWLNTVGGIVLYGSEGLEGYYNIERCRQWGAQGVSQKYVDLAKKHPIQDVTMVTTAAQARDAIAAGFPISICGSTGRTMKRQPNGWCPRSGTWNHCQALIGVGVANDGRNFFVYVNSWGDYLGSTNNVVSLASGKTMILQEGMYIADFESVERDLRQQDSFAYSNAVGWEAQKLDWLV